MASLVPHENLDAATDGELIRRAQRTYARGDEHRRETARRAIAVVLLRHRDLVRATIAAKVPRQDVDDCCSEVSLRFCARVLRGGEITNPAGLLVRISQFVRADYLAARGEPAAALDGWEPGGADAALDEAASRELVERLLAPLDGRQRAIVWRRIVEERPSIEVAAEMGTTPGNIDVIVYRQLKRLREGPW